MFAQYHVPNRVMSTSAAPTPVSNPAFNCSRSWARSSLAVRGVRLTRRRGITGEGPNEPSSNCRAPEASTRAAGTLLTGSTVISGRLRAAREGEVEGG